MPTFEPLPLEREALDVPVREGHGFDRLVGQSGLHQHRMVTVLKRATRADQSSITLVQFRGSYLVDAHSDAA